MTEAAEGITVEPPGTVKATTHIQRWFSDPYYLGICLLCGLVGIALADEHGCRADLLPPPTPVRPAMGFDAMMNRPRSRPASRPPTGTPGHHPTSSKAVVARLDGLVATLAAAPVGQRNGILHWVACRVAEMLAAGELPDARMAADALATVALGVGLEPREVVATIDSGFATYGVVA